MRALGGLESARIGGQPPMQQQIKQAKPMTKLEKLLAQPDIFETLRKVNTGEIRSYDDLICEPIDVYAPLKRRFSQTSEYKPLADDRNTALNRRRSTSFAGPVPDEDEEEDDYDEMSHENEEATRLKNKRSNTV